MSCWLASRLYNMQDALRRAVAQDASLTEQYPELASLVAKNEAEAEKEKGNKAFSEKRSASGSPPSQTRHGNGLHARRCLCCLLYRPDNHSHS